MGTSKRQQSQQLPEKLRLIRIYAGYTQRQLSEFLDKYDIIHQPNISYYESGKRPLPLRLVLPYVEINCLTAPAIFSRSFGLVR
jgi:transcriptional regulator with XRE-family HTH domain